MNTIDEQGNIVGEEAGFNLGTFGPLMDTVRTVQSLQGLHSAAVAMPINRKSVLAAVGVAAVLGVAYFMNRPQPTPDDEEFDDEGDDDEN